MKDKLFVGITVAFLIIGLCIFLYPTVGNIVNKITSAAEISGYTENVDNMAPSDIEKKLLTAREYNRRLAGGEPLGEMPEDVKFEDYPEYFSVGSVLGVISIPEIGVNLPIFTGDSGEALLKGVWLLDNTSLPVGGESTHAVLSGHRGLPSATLFSNLDKLKCGDVFYIKVLGEELAYEVDNIETVLPSEVDGIGISEGEDYVTLVTCTPYGINTHRLLVRGKRCALETGAESVQSRVDTTVIIPTFNLVLACTALLGGIALAVSVRKRKKRAGRRAVRKYFD